MLEQNAQLWILIGFAIIGVLAGLAQMNAQRTCGCCGLDVSRGETRCPHCRCHMA